jgi:hypothetical protein
VVHRANVATQALLDELQRLEADERCERALDCRYCAPRICDYCGHLESCPEQHKAAAR